MNYATKNDLGTRNEENSANDILLAVNRLILFCRDNEDEPFASSLESDLECLEMMINEDGFSL